MAASRELLNGFRSWRRFHLRNWPTILVVFAGTLGSSIVVIATIGIVPAVGAWVLMAIAYLVGLTSQGRA